MGTSEVIVKHTAPEGFVMIPNSEFEKFQNWKSSQQRIRTWNLREFAQYRYGTQNTQRASRYLFRHHDDLSLASGGFIDYNATHNGWRIPVGPMIDYLEAHKEA
ncbi:DUF771 domain-containing protein [Levilactobacillus andaensis]|uniref:DUF771 domain-containing protein n=1 Tax=Levilactobacillus andaensis TaxID=2799570 RepID=UPI0019442AF9|nr:DUF771 domain-containing protein [Levilactobacillus andaensis]